MPTFEYEQPEEALHIHANPAELRHLATLFTQLAESIERTGHNHVHLHTPQWGGNELSEEKQSVSSSLINHVKIHGWPNS